MLTYSLTKVSANKLADAYEALQVHDYFKAKHLFYSLNTKKHNAHAAYGLSVIYFRNNNPFYNLDSAAKYATISFNTYASKPLFDTLSGFSLNQQTCKALIDSIAFRQLNTCFLNNSVKAFDSFLSTNYLASQTYIYQATRQRDQLEFNHVIGINHSDSTRQFMITHPLSAFKPEAFRLYEKQVYEELTSDKSEQSYILFIASCPKSAHMNAAYRALLEIYNSTKNKNGLINFIRNYPQAPQINDAWQLLFTLSIKNFTKDELENFIVAYPAFPFKPSILKEMQLNDLVLIPIQKNERIGFADTTGKIMIEPVFDEVSEFNEGLSSVHKNDSVFFINKENHNNIQRVFVDALPYTNGLAPVKLNNQWYLIDRLGVQKTQAFDDMNELSEGVYIVKHNNLYGSIDEYGQLTNDIKYEKMGDFKNACAYYQLNGKYGFITKDGYMHKPEFEWISDFSKLGICIYKKDNKFGLIKNNGRIFTPPLYDQIIPCTNSIYLFVINTSYGFYSADGCFLSTISYDYEKERNINEYTNGNSLKLIRKKEQALIDLNGKMSCDFGVFTEIYLPSNGLIRVKKNNKFGYVDSKLNLVLPLKYLYAEDFTDSTAIVSTKKGYHVINLKGDEVINSPNKIERIAKNYFLVETDGANTLYNHKGVDLLSTVSSYEIYKNFLIVYLQNNKIKILRI